MIIIIHQREERKKCSLTPIRDMSCFTIQSDREYDLPDNAILLHPDGPMLSQDDDDRELVLVDATWKDFRKFMNREPEFQEIPIRSISGMKTAYPRKPKKGVHPSHHLASIEVIFCAGFILDRSDYMGVIEHYHFRDRFIEINGLEKVLQVHP